MGERSPKAQDVFPGGRLHVNGAEGGRNLRERVTALETGHKHLATKADLEKGLRATELRLSKEAQENKEELRQEIQGIREAMWKQPIVILVGVAALMAISANWDKFFS